MAILGGKHSLTVNGETFDINEQLGFDNSKVLRIRGKGKSYNGRRGDLLLKVEVASDPSMKE